MKVFLDEREYAAIPEGADAASILRAIRADTIRGGRVITDIQVDGVSLEEETFIKVTGGLIARFSSRLVRELVQESLAEALQYIPRLTKGFEEIAVHFEQNDTSAAQAKLAGAAEGLDWLLAVFVNCGSIMNVAKDESGAGFEEMKASLFKDIDALGTLHEERKYAEMPSCIRSNVVPDIEKLHLYVQKLYELGASTQ